MKILNLQQNTGEWKEFRRSKIGASDIGVLMTGTDKQIYDLYLEKKEGKEKFVSDAMKQGAAREKEALAFYEQFSGIKFNCLVGQHPAEEWLIASFDGINLDKGISLEIKCPVILPSTPEKLISFEKYEWQVQAQMAVGGHSRAILFIYTPEGTLEHIIERNEEKIEKLIAQGKWFYNCLLNDIPPIYIEEIYDEAFYQKAKEIKTELERLEKEMASIKEEALRRSGGVPLKCFGLTLSKGGDVLVTDYRKAAIEAKLNLTPYQTQREGSWRLTVK